MGNHRKISSNFDPEGYPKYLKNGMTEFGDVVVFCRDAR